MHEVQSNASSLLSIPWKFLYFPSVLSKWTAFLDRVRIFCSSFRSLVLLLQCFSQQFFFFPLFVTLRFTSSKGISIPEYPFSLVKTRWIMIDKIKWCESRCTPVGLVVHLPNTIWCFPLIQTRCGSCSSGITSLIQFPLGCKSYSNTWRRLWFAMSYK